MKSVSKKSLSFALGMIILSSIQPAYSNTVINQLPKLLAYASATLTSSAILKNLLDSRTTCYLATLINKSPAILSKLDTMAQTSSGLLTQGVALISKDTTFSAYSHCVSLAETINKYTTPIEWGIGAIVVISAGLTIKNSWDILTKD